MFEITSHWNGLLLGALVLAPALAVFLLIRSELSQLGLRTGVSACLPWCRAIAVGLIAFTLCEPIWTTRNPEGQPGRLVVLIDESESMTQTDRPSADSSASRWQRAVQDLTAPESILDQAKQNFRVSVHGIGNAGLRPLTELLTWNSETPPHLSEPEVWVSQSPLGQSLIDAVSNDVVDTSEPPAAIVLLTDGQNNTGISMREASLELNEMGIPLFSIGYGPTSVEHDVAVNDITAPRRVFREGRLQGNVDITESTPAGSKYTVNISFHGKTVWTQEIVSQNLTSRPVPFDIEVDELRNVIQAGSSTDTTITNLAARLEVNLQMEAEEVTANNSGQLFTTIVMRRASVLLIDGRSRWETRYVRNLFERDPGWEITSEVAKSNAETLSKFPASREELFRYNLVILGDIPEDLFEPKHLLWLREFVQVGGGGIILLDGNRRNLANVLSEDMKQLFPVTWEARESNNLEKRLRVTAIGEVEKALWLEDSQSEQATALWTSLPNIEFLAPVRPLPGSEVLVVAENEFETLPVIVTRRSGSGRTMFVASDELWKWRYEVADRYHTRLWNQLARKTMRSPYSLSNDFVSLDTGDPAYQLGDTVEIRTQLRGPSGEPSVLQTVTAILESDEHAPIEIALVENQQMPGTYSASTKDLPPGNYRARIQAGGFSSEALQLVSQFSVLRPSSQEMRYVTCAETVMQQATEISGGEYTHESDAKQIIEQLSPVSTVTWSRSTTILWSSYYWFFAALGLLAIDWLIRKRIGLI